MDREELKEKIIDVCDKYLRQDYILFVFGSYNKIRMIKSSDIDLAVYSDTKISPSLIVYIKEEIDEKVRTLRDVDLVNLTDEAIGVSLLKSILEEGIIWREGKNSKELLKNLKKRLENSGK